MNGRTWYHLKPLAVYLLLALAFAAGVFGDRAGVVPGSAWREPPGLAHTFEPFWEAWRLVQRHYVDREAVRPDRLTEGAIGGMVAALGDVGHSSYLSAADVEHLRQSLEGHFEGIGARMSVRKGVPTVVYVFPGSPAARAGLRATDVLEQVDGQPLGELPLTRVVEMVRGPAGTVVHLRVLRAGHPGPIDLDITRAQLPVPDVTWHMLPGETLAHVGIHNFGEQADAQLREALAGARAQGATGLVLDVRLNPGGLKEQAVAVTSEFLKEGTVFIEQNARGEREAVPVQPGGRATVVPVCVLIDEGTASSAEIFAGALQDHGRGKLVGTKTFGTGTVLRQFPLSDGSALLLAVAEWFTPNGRQIWHKGIKPDVEVKLQPDDEILLPELEEGMTAAALAKSKDPQLLKAIALLKQGAKR